MLQQDNLGLVGRWAWIVNPRLASVLGWYRHAHRGACFPVTAVIRESQSVIFVATNNHRNCAGVLLVTPTAFGRVVRAVDRSEGRLWLGQRSSVDASLELGKVVPTLYRLTLHEHCAVARQYEEPFWVREKRGQERIAHRVDHNIQFAACRLNKRASVAEALLESCWLFDIDVPPKGPLVDRVGLGEIHGHKVDGLAIALTKRVESTDLESEWGSRPRPRDHHSPTTGVEVIA